MNSEFTNLKRAQVWPLEGVRSATALNFRGWPAGQTPYPREATPSERPL